MSRFLMLVVVVVWILSHLFLFGNGCYLFLFSLFTLINKDAIMALKCKRSEMQVYVSDYKLVSLLNTKFMVALSRSTNFIEFCYTM